MSYTWTFVNRFYKIINSISWNFSYAQSTFESKLGRIKISSYPANNAALAQAFDAQKSFVFCYTCLLANDKIGM